jgi:hypothetical protein
VRVSIRRSFLIVVICTPLFLATGPVAMAGDISPRGSTLAASDPSRATLPGATLWSTRYTRRGPDGAAALGVSPGGSTVFVTGYNFGHSTQSDYATLAYDVSTGAALWSRPSRYVRPGTDYATALGVSPDGSTVFVTGASEGSASGFDYATVAYGASTGAARWATRYDGPSDGADYSSALGVSPDGSKVFVTGQSAGSTTDTDFATVAYDAVTGAMLWERRYNGAGNGPDVATALGVSPDGSQVFVTGRNDGPRSGIDFDYTTLAYDAATGATSWRRHFNGPFVNGGDFATALGVSPDGSEVFVTGGSAGPTGDYDYVTVAYDAARGTKLWSKRYNGPANGPDGPRALGVSPDSSVVFVTGQVTGSTGALDYATVAYDAETGAKLWLRSYSRTEADVAYALGVSPDGSEVFVTGQSAGSTTAADYATVAYDAATGATLWSRRYTRPGNDIAYALGVSPDGSKVFVTGSSQGSTSSSDYATVAYST